MKLETIFSVTKPIIGMIHLKPLPGSPNYDRTTWDMKKIIDFAVEEAKILESAGINGLQIENYWDEPFLKGEKIGYETCTAMTAAACEIAHNVSIPIGINVHMNGGKAAMAVACATGAKWVRVFEFVSAYVSYTGITEGIGGELSRYRRMLDAKDIQLLCDVNVKHGSHYIVHDRSVNELAYDAQEQGADGIIITGFSTGIAPTKEKVVEASKNIEVPIILGSGIKAENAEELLSVSDGAIVGSAFKTDGNMKNIVDYNKARAFMREVERIRG
ncbi:BtpA/SgcQ family protein [Faecalicatena contorta]|uniref:BtpA/SgcQ family protein n=1 Tax=Faecalicatena contorta TaxID=39482 RepID=UPI001F3251BD|nr:BtpA/SgcQ family protein [Faecalicatena contorta]